jgi:hypothetical protein
MRLQPATLRSTFMGFIAVCLLSAGCAKSAPSGAAKDTGGPDKGAAAKPLFTGSAEDLAKEWAKDKDGFGKKYKDQIVQVQGEVMDPKLGPGSFSIKAYDPPEGATIIFSCYYPKGKSADLASKQKVKIQGKVISRNVNPVGPEIIDCDILEK